MTPFPDMLKTYQKLFEAAVWPVWIADINNQKIIWANHSSLTTLGVNPEKLIGFPLDRILHLRGNEQENRTIRELVIKENHFSAYFDPYKSVESTIDDIIDNNRIFVQPVLSEDYIILYLRPGKSPLLNMMLSSSDRFIMRLDNTSNIEELLPTAYWNRIVPEGSFFKKGVTDLVLPEDWRRFCDGRKIFIQTAAEYRVTNKTPFIPLADDLFAELSSFSQNGNVNTVFYFKKAYDLSNKDYTINCTIESVSDEGFALLFDQKVPFRNRGYQFGLTLLSGMRAWTLKKNTYYVKIAACTESITDPLTISITKTGPFLTFTVNDRIVFQFIDEATDNDDLKGFGLRFRGKSKFTSYKVSTRSCGLKKEQLVLNSDTITLTHLPNRKFAIEVIYVEIWDTPGLPEISEAFIVKDVTELKEVEHEKDLFKNRYNALKKQDYHGFVFSNKEIGNIIEQLDNFADSKASILIHGPTGTGKGVLANAIHHRSSRKNGPFIRVDCASIPQSLMERELFGHEKGAFTGAFAQSPGKFESADKGTLFLDEIGNIDPATQAKLLGFLEDHTFCRIGGTTPIKVDVRIIAATNADLSSMMRAKTFREDLYYRLRVFDISLPALRDRKDDIPLLVDHFIKEINRKYKLAVSSIEPETMESLMGNDWPGNVRELYNSILNLALSARQGVISGNASAIKQKESTNHKRVFIPDTVRHDRIIDLAKKNRFISAKDCMHEIKVSLPTVKRDLKALTEKGVLTKQGNGPSVRYKIN